MSDLKPIPTWSLVDGTPIKWVDIVITSYERLAFTFEMLQMIKQHTDYLHRVIVVDNGSKDQAALTAWKNNGLIDVLLLLDKNYGLEPAKNYGLSLVRSPLYIDSDNDCLPSPRLGGVDWLTRLVTLMYEHPDYAAIACPPQVFIGANKSELFNHSGDIKEWDKAGGSLRLMRTDVVREVGAWRTNPADMVEANRSEEWYISAKIRALGYKVGYAKNIECFHMFGDDSEWGYGPDTPHYHRDQHPKPVDAMFGSKQEWYNKFI